MIQKIVAIIPARGGSKGIPRKNLSLLNGKPLLYYSVHACINSYLIDETWVSSDNEEILNYAKSLGAKTIKRPKSLCTDEASSESALLHFADNVTFDTLVFVQATSPLITDNIITSALCYYNENTALDSLVSGHIDHGFWWSNGIPLFDPNNRPPRQIQGNLYKESGMFYITSRSKLLESKCRYSGNSEIYPIDKLSALEIDSKEDLKLVELIMLRRKENV
jgi:N-acylneuraminate cytidylyltransferase